MTINNFFIISGLSGSGKSLINDCFEDQGFFCIDNLPVSLLPKFFDLCEKSNEQINNFAAVIDIRDRDFLSDFHKIYSNLKKNTKNVKLIFLEATDEVLVRRFSETRRRHPLEREATILQKIREERKLLEDIRKEADKIIDTSKFTVHDFRNYILDYLSGGSHPKLLHISIISFGFKYGIPYDSDLMLDVRFLPNPYFNSDLKDKKGIEEEIRQFVTSKSQYKEFFKRTKDYISYLLPQYAQEGKSQLTLSVGCTGGRHRSVVFADDLAKVLQKEGYKIRLYHRDIEKE
jgi:UPF0042 nucleotide-binding protein